MTYFQNNKCVLVYFTHVLFLFALLVFTCGHAQDLSKSELKLANTIKLFVADKNIDEASARFADYITKKGFPVAVYNSTGKQQESKPESSYLQLNQDADKPEILKNSNLGDSVASPWVSLFNPMWGNYNGSITYIVEKTPAQEITITLTAYVISNAFGMSTMGSRMQKGGKKTNWAQKDIFNELDEILNEYPKTEKIIYLID